MDEGILGSGFDIVYTYDGIAKTHTLTTLGNNIVAGTIYTFKYTARNAIGNSSVVLK